MDRDKGADAEDHENLARLDHQPSVINIKLEGNCVMPDCITGKVTDAASARTVRLMG